MTLYALSMILIEGLFPLLLSLLFLYKIEVLFFKKFEEQNFWIKKVYG